MTDNVRSRVRGEITIMCDMSRFRGCEREKKLPAPVKEIQRNVKKKKKVNIEIVKYVGLEMGSLSLRWIGIRMFCTLIYY